MTFRAYNPDTDQAAVHRIWIETGWIDDDKSEKAAMDGFIGGGRANVAAVNGEAECLVLSMPGTVRHLQDDLPFSCVTSVTTSRVARKQGLAGRLTALTVAQDVADGAVVAGLGMFEQGYYNRLGFGSGAYEVRMTFDPAAINVDPARRSPVRLGKDDWEAIHAARLRRWCRHGACKRSSPAAFTRAEMAWSKNGFGLGFRDRPDGGLSHHMWIGIRDDVEYGPYSVYSMAYRNRAEFLELLGLLRNLGDQVTAVRILNPPGVQMQDLVQEPFRRRRLTESSKMKCHAEAFAFWQMSICDLPRCLEQTKLSGDTVRFNLRLTDPIETFLGDDAPWRGIGGDYMVTLGPSSGAERGADVTLPTLDASVGAFTRLWLGVRPASGLAVTDELRGDDALIEQLDHAVRLPSPHPDWDF